MSERQIHPILSIASGISIFTFIGNIVVSAVRLKFEGIQVGFIINIVISSIFLLLVLLLSGAIVYENWIAGTGPITRSSFNENIYLFFQSANSWQITLFTVGAFLYTIGIVAISYDSGIVILGAIMAGFSYAYFLSTERVKEAIVTLLPAYSSIPLEDLSKMIGKDSKQVKEALITLIVFESFPAKLDPITNVIYYLEDETNQVENKEVGTDSVTKTEATSKLPSCPYCGETAIVIDAKFCAECGASMVPVK